MRPSHLSSHVAISETVIAAVVAEVSETGRTRTVVDGYCTALRLIVTSSASPCWLLFCYNEQGKLEKRSIGYYPAITVEEARERAWKLRLQVKGFVRKASPSSELTLERLLLLRESHCAKSTSWGNIKNDIVRILKPFAFCSLQEVNTKKLKIYIENYPYPASMKKALITTGVIIAWAEESSVIEFSNPSLANCIAAGIKAAEIKEAKKALRHLK
jgi:hypothetical protein